MAKSGKGRSRRLREHKERWRNCRLCSLHETADRKVFARGKIPCDILFIGEAPGPAENDVGQPFVGRSGRLLDDWILMLQKETYNFSWCMTNTVLCYPGRNDDGDGFNSPNHSQCMACRPRLKAFIEIATPKCIVALGKTAEEIGNCGEIDIPVRPVYHPAYLVRNGGMSSPQFKRTHITLVHFIRSVLLDNWEG